MKPVYTECECVGQEERGVIHYQKVLKMGVHVGGTTMKSPQESVLHPRHIWCIRTSLSVELFQVQRVHPVDLG